MSLWERLIFKVATSNLTGITFIAQHKHEERLVSLSFFSESLFKLSPILFSLLLNLIDFQGEIFDAFVGTMIF